MQPVSRTDPEEVRPLAPREFEQIRKLAYDTFGLDLKDGKQDLVSARLRRLVRAHGYNSYQDYFRHVQSDRTGDSLAGMIDALATNHTSFLREPEHFRYLQEKIVPSWAGRKHVEIWSAACSTGEEVWTLVFLLHEAMPSCDVKIIGTDISNKALSRARMGLYPVERSGGLPAHWYQRYLHRGEGEWRGWYKVANEFRSRVEFRRLNLMESIHWPHPFPIVFCRNVMIYFDKVTQEKVVNKLAQHIEPGGWLFVGHAESLTGVHHPLEYIRPAIYRRPPERGRP
jgi:chemotaxis protein methyltransferase CheR